MQNNLSHLWPLNAEFFNLRYYFLFTIHNFSNVLSNELVACLCIYLAIYLLDCMYAHIY